MKRVIYAVLSACLALSLMSACTAGDTVETTIAEPSSTAQTITIEEYREAIAKSRSAIWTASIYLSDLGEYEHILWNASISVGSNKGLTNDYIDDAFRWLSENSDGTKASVNGGYSVVRDQYKEIILMEIEGAEATELRETYSAMYEAYTDLYTLVTTPSRSISDFENRFNESVSVIKEADIDLGLFLD